MTQNSDRCSQLRKFHEYLTNEVKALRENLQRAQQEGVSTSAESLKILRSLQAALSKVTRELQECPPVTAEVRSQEQEASSLVRQAKSTLPEHRVRNWFPDSVRRDDEESIIDTIEM
ncbi:hypothetical protein [Ktedonospora formicarum]|uniref:Uncharacterized protein n=1 Tax=Ktedonospora formicarum TaxID=2778364 RepID=A0A8J3MS16_9CHLR|nr:hypothetical protein [Ktedonospora formicarum]GHO42875.1 hypothetical protein KSX_10380 [Ktedonospora formicarum]